MQSQLVELTTDIISSYVEKNSISASDLPALIQTVYAALSRTAEPDLAEAPAPRPTSAQIRKSITPDGLVSFVDGKSYKTLKRHLTGHGLTFAQYREQYGLPKDYPTVAPSYSAKRSELAKALGLGQGGRGGAAKAKAAAPAQTKPKATRKKAAAQ